MVKKQQKTAAPKKGQGRRKNAADAPPKTVDTPFAEQVKASAQQIWSAGLAAFAKAQDRGGSALGTLASEGARLRETARGAEAQLNTAARRMDELAGEVAGEVGSRAGQHWDKLESIFEDRVARALSRLGMPAAEEITRLNERIDALSAEVAMLRAAVAPARSSPARNAAKKPSKDAKDLKATKTARTAKPAKPRSRTT